MSKYKYVSISEVIESFNIKQLSIAKDYFLCKPGLLSDRDKGTFGFIDCSYPLERKEELLRDSAVDVIIIDKSLVNLANDLNKKYLIVDNPRLVFVKVCRKYFLPKPPSSLHPTSLISQKAKIGKNCYIGAYTIIEDEVEIGNNTFISDNCSILGNVKIGSNVNIYSGVRIGNPGLGSVKDEYGDWVDFPHFGDIQIGDNVVIGDNTVINKGTLNTTVIGRGTRIGGNNVLCHGVNVGENCFIAQGTVIAGSVVIGNNSWIASGSTVRDGIRIGKNCVVGLGSGLIKNIPDNEVWGGVPAKFLKNNEQK